MRFNLFIVTILVVACFADGKAAYVQQKSCTIGPLYWCSHLSTAMQCNAVEQCLPIWKQKSHYRSPAESKRANVICHMSEIAILSIKSSLQTDRPLNHLLPFLPESCTRLTHLNSKFAPMCNDISSLYLMPVITLLKNGVSPHVISELLNHCNEESAQAIHIDDLKPKRRAEIKERVPAMRTFTPEMNQNPVKTKPLETIECSVCVRVLNYVDSVLTENSTEAEIEQTLELICQYLPTTLTQSCDELVAKYLPLLVRLIVAEFTPAEICQALGMCPRATINHPQVEIKEHPIVKKPQQSTPSVNGIKCSVCARVMIYVDSFITKNSSEEEIEHALETVCNFVTDKKECQDLIDEYTPALISLILNQLSPVQICQQIGMCPKAINPQTVLPKTKTHQAKKGSLECSLCTHVINYAESQLSSNATEEEVEQVLERVCSFLPAKIRTECDNLIEAYTPILVKLILEGLSPLEICQAIGLCKASSFKHPLTKLHGKAFLGKVKTTKPETSSLECAGCVHIFNYVDAFLSKNSTEEEIETALDKVCPFLPASLRADCSSLIDQYTPVLIELIEAEFTPREICHVLGLCDSAKSSKCRVIKQITKKPKIKGIECSACVHVMNYVDSFLEKNSTEEEIQKSVERVCKYLPTKMTTKCDAFVEEYAPVLVKLIVAEFTPSQICKALELCPKKHKKLQKLHFPIVQSHRRKHNVCQEGPQRWCASVEIAKTCGVHAMLVCHRSYWGKPQY